MKRRGARAKVSWAQGCFYLANKAYPQLQTDKEPVVPVVIVRSVLRATQSVMILQRNCLNVVSGSFQQNKMRHIFFHGPLCACISLPLPGHSHTMLRPALAREAAGRDHGASFKSALTSWTTFRPLQLQFLLGWRPGSPWKDQNLLVHNLCADTEPNCLRHFSQLVRTCLAMSAH